MEHLAAFMIIIACNGGLDSCREIPVETVGYETLQDCRAEQPLLQSRASGEGDVVVARCVEIDPLYEGDLTIVWEVNDDHELTVELETPGKDVELLVAQIDPATKKSRITQ